MPASCRARHAPSLLQSSFYLSVFWRITGPLASDHHLTVNEWYERVARGRTVAALIQAFEAAFATLWQRSNLTLGEVTLTAIVERVLHTATEQFPMLKGVEVGPSGLRCEDLRTQAGVPDDELSSAIRFVLVEFLTVLGNLTAQILTPALHAELSKGHGVADGATEDPAS